MGLVSTGLGQVTDRGSIQQSFCLPSGGSQLHFDWNFLSEEFRNYCNQGYNDTFRVSVNGAVAFEQSVDDLCSGPLTFVPGLTFDSGDDVYATGWQSATLPIGGGGRITVRFEVDDFGDSDFDTAVLLDNIRID